MCIKSTILVGVTGAMGLILASSARAQVECATIVIDDGSDHCPTYGTCDDASERDLWDHTRLSAEPNRMRIRMRMHVFVDEQHLSNQTIEDQWQKVADDLAMLNMVPAYTWHRITGSDYELLEEESDVNAMKAAYANSPDTQLNIYVTDIGGSLGFGGRGYYPWGENVLSTGGGIMIDKDKIDDFRTTLTHEVGHNLGLWHTHHGWSDSELRDHGDGCDSYVSGEPCDCHCYEAIDDPDCDEVGDFCCDTPATPYNTTCQETTAQNLCDAQEFDSDWENFMSVSLDGVSTPCREHLSTQQKRRMLCWACDTVSGWIDGQDCDDNGVVDECDLARGDATDCIKTDCSMIANPSRRGRAASTDAPKTRAANSITRRVPAKRREALSPGRTASAR